MAPKTIRTRLRCVSKKRTLAILLLGSIPPGGGGDSLIKGAEMLVGNFELNP